MAAAFGCLVFSHFTGAPTRPLGPVLLVQPAAIYGAAIFATRAASHRDCCDVRLRLRPHPARSIVLKDIV